MVPKNPMQWSMRHFHTLEHFTPERTDGKIQSLKDQSVQFEWDWKEDKIFGGLDNFFVDNSTVLDLGSGKGIAVNEINEQFADRQIKCVGVDYRYLQEQQTAKNLVAGDFANLPFKDESFDRLLSVESFPCWLPDKELAIDKYIEEITRVSKIGTIWRGTLPEYDEYDTIKFPTDSIIRKLVENGWELVISGNSFSAKLVIKK
jgi:ubiquinone/menaquinone biosynthesis C-methylase UbiE